MVSKSPNFFDFCIGTWRLGGMHFGPYDTRLAHRMLESAVDSGLRSFDTAYFYSKGMSNVILSKHLHVYPRNTYHIMAKVGLKWDGNNVIHDTSSAHIEEELYRTLDSLGLDYLDTYLLHWPSRNTSLLDSCLTLASLCQKGLVRSWGLANVNPADLNHHIMNLNPTCYHLKLNLLTPNTFYLNKLLLLGFKIYAYSLLEGGLLTQKFELSKLSKKDWRRKNPNYCNPVILAYVDGLRSYCEKRETVLEVLAIEWVLTHNLTGVIFGPRTLEQLNFLVSIMKEI